MTDKSLTLFESAVVEHGSQCSQVGAVVGSCYFLMMQQRNRNVHTVAYTDGKLPWFGKLILTVTDW